ncbi:MAG: methionyl-tRNA formyltransferase [Sedimentisphaerales bacterium]|nr:methionyl-tRNA formyltransferase [Sedimentisphaerales bacterium]
MRTVYLGSGAFGVDTLRWLGASEHEVLLVVTQPARPAGRGRKVQPTPIAQLCVDMELPCREIDNVNDPEVVESIKKLKPDILLVIAFGQKIGTELLNLPICKVINLHASLLPKYRGAAPINWAIINGERETGLTVIELNEVWDGGDIYGQLATRIDPGETAGELHDRLAHMGPELMAGVMEKIENGSIEAMVQDGSHASRAPKLRKNQAAVQWNHPAEQIRNFIHGMWPWPGAFCHLQHTRSGKVERVSLVRAEAVSQLDSPVSLEPIAEPGTMAHDMSVFCSLGRIKLLEVRPENSKVMNFDSFVNGRGLQPGDIFLDG